MPEKLAGRGQEVAPALHEREIVVSRDAANAVLADFEERRARERDEERRVGRDDDLASFALHRREERDEAEARLKRERGLGLVEKVDADVLEAMAQDREERLAVRSRLETFVAPRLLRRAAIFVVEEFVHRLGAQEEARGRSELVRSRVQMKMERRVLDARLRSDHVRADAGLVPSAWIDRGEGFDERALAAAVFADDGVDLAAAQL